MFCSNSSFLSCILISQETGDSLETDEMEKHEPVHCSMFCSNSSFLSCIQISQETGDSLETDEMEKLKHERNNALEQVKTLKVISNLASLYFLLYKEKKENYLVLNSGVSRLSVCFFKEYQYQIA